MAFDFLLCIALCKEIVKNSKDKTWNAGLEDKSIIPELARRKSVALSVNTGYGYLASHLHRLNIHISFITSILTKIQLPS